MQSKFKRWIVAALPLAMVCSVSAQGKVTDVTTRAIDGGLAVHIGGSDLAKPTTKWDNGALVLEFQADLGSAGKTWRPNLGGIKAISYSQKGHSVQVAVRPSSTGRQPQIVKVNDGWLMFFDEAVTEKIPAPKQTTKGSANVHADPVPVNPRDFKPKALVTLNFVDTDLQQILKALAMQANVNVAMGPDVTGKVTVNLDNVPVDEAMEMVTTLGGVRFAYVNNTYVVASASRFPDMMESISHRSGLVSETRVVPLFSREGNQIKAAILKMVPPSTENGRYELVLPSEKLSVDQAQLVTPMTGKDDKGSTSTQTNTMVQQKSTDDATKKDDYIVLVGTPSRMDSVEASVRSLDQQICMALGIKVGTTQAIVRKTYEPKGILAQDLLKALLGPDKKEFDGVELIATPGLSAAKQAIVCSGREFDVDRVMRIFTELDSAPDSANTSYEVVNLKYVMPNYVWSELTKDVPGLKVSFLPPPIDPKVGIDYKEQGTLSGGKSNGGDSGGSGNAGGSGGGATGGSGGSGGDSGSSGSGSSGGQLGSGGQANTAIKTSTKANTFPMKLLLRGTADQIAAAKQYIAMVDIAPRQVAVELRVMELTHEEALKVGLDWSLLTGGTLKSIHINQNPFGDDTNPGNIGSTLKFHGGGTASILGALDAISNKNNVVARPSILANDGVPTNIFVGDEVRYVKSITTSQNGPSVITDEIDVGVDFTVTARIGDGGNILLSMEPTLKVLEGFTPVPGGGSLPQTSRRSAQSQMSIKSGETIAIGGLIQEQDRKSKKGIPFLRDLPIIGHLFSRTDNDKIRSEVVFFVTVKEVTDADRQGAANPNQAERDNTKLPGDKKGG